MKQQKNVKTGLNESVKGTQSMGAAYKAASKISNKLIEENDPEGYKYLKEVKESDVIIVRGSYDHGQVIFELCGIPYSLIDDTDVEGIELRHDQILFINCPGHLTERGLEKVKSFVNGGGMLVTTDWSLTYVLQKIYPKLVRYNNVATSDDVVRVYFEKVDDTFLNGLLDKEEEPLWWLEGSSYPIEILDQKKVKILVSSKEMKEKYGENPIVITFEAGEGKVYHMTSHFYLQRSETRTNKQKESGGSYSKIAQIKDKSMLGELDGLDSTTVGEMEAAYTSARSLSNMVMEQKKRVKARESRKK